MPQLPHGVFRGQREGGWDLYVIDPAVPSVESVIDQWNGAWERTNPTWLQRLVFGATLVVVVAVIVIGLGYFVWRSREWGTYLLLLGLAIIVGVIAGWGVESTIPGRGRKNVEPPDGVMTLSHYVQDWVSPSTAHTDVWELNLEIVRYLQLERISFDESTPEGAWAAAEVGGLVQGRADLQEQRVKDVAGRVGFVIPDTGLDHYSDDYE